MCNRFHVMNYHQLYWISELYALKLKLNVTFAEKKNEKKKNLKWEIYGSKKQNAVTDNTQKWELKRKVKKKNYTLISLWISHVC